MRKAQAFESAFVIDDEQLTESRVLRAYQVLFADAGLATSGLLQAVQLPEIKKAYRRRALDTHPDRFASSDELHRKRCTESFIEVTNAYETLNCYLALREKGLVFERKGAGKWESVREDQAPPRSRPTPARSSEKRSQSDCSFSYWEREVPGRGLRFGEFLYYSRIVPWQALIGALVWQRRGRPRIGEIAQHWRWVTEPQLAGLLRGRRLGERLGEILLRHRLISPFQLQVLLWQQQKFQKPIGEYFLRQGFLTQARLQRFLQHQHQHNLRFRSEFSPGFHQPLR